MSIVELWFGWPGGAVWSNIVASAIWSVPTISGGVLIIIRKMKQHHEIHMNHLTDLHRKVDKMGVK